MDNFIKADLYRYIPKPYKNSNLLVAMRSQGFRYMFFRRLEEKHRSKFVIGLFYKILLHHYTIKYGFQIGGKIGKGFYIGHFGTIIVNNDANIGENCNISPGVTIGATNRGQKKGVPILGNKVWIGTNAIIVGKIVIGDNVLIAPGTYVNIDVPSNSIVVGNPAKIIHNLDATNGYINNIYE